VILDLIKDACGKSYKRPVKVVEAIVLSPVEVVEDEDDLEEARIMREKIDLVEELSSYSRAQDIYRDFSPQAARQLVFESKYGKTSSDRRNSSTEILDRAHGKPINRQVSLSMNASDMSVEDLKSKNENLMRELGYIEGANRDRLIIGETATGEAIPVSSRREGSPGQESSEES